jgi:hypothetical protein
MRSKRARLRGVRVGFLSLGVLLLAVGWAGCLEETETCESSAECASGELCGGAGAGPYHCLKDCTRSDTCPAGYECRGVTSADCPGCDVITNACVARVPLPRL